jgi:hypothetical protein
MEFHQIQSKWDGIPLDQIRVEWNSTTFSTVAFYCSGLWNAIVDMGVPLPFQVEYGLERGIGLYVGIPGSEASCTALEFFFPPPAQFVHSSGILLCWAFANDTIQCIFARWE